MKKKQNIMPSLNDKGEQVVNISTKKGEIKITKTKRSEIVAIQQNNGVA